MKRLLLALLLTLPLALFAQAPVQRNTYTTNAPGRTPNILATSSSALYPLMVLNPDGSGVDRQVLFSPSWFMTGTNLTVIGRIGADSASFSNMTVTNFYTSNFYATNIYVTNLYSSNIYSTNIFTTNLYATNIYTSNFFATNVFTTNLYATNIYTSNFFATNVFTTNLYVTNVYSSNVYATNIFATNLIGLANFDPTQFRTNNSSVSIKSGPILTNLQDTGTAAVNALVSSNSVSVLGTGTGILDLAASGDSLHFSLVRAASPSTNAYVTTPSTIQSGFLYTTFSGTNGTESYVPVLTNAVSVNGTNVNTPNLTNTATVTWALSGSNITATSSGALSGGTTGLVPVWTSSTTMGNGGAYWTNSVFDVNPGLSTAFYGPDGSATSPGIGFSADRRIGIARVNIDALSILVPTVDGSANGSVYFKFMADGLHAGGLDLTNTFKLQPGAGAGKVLQSDTNGVGTWATPSADSTGTNIVTLTQTGTNISQMDFALLQFGGAFKLSLTNNGYVGAPTGTASSPFRKAWLIVQQPSTGTCILQFTNGWFAWPQGVAPVVDTNNGSVAVFEFVTDVFTNGLVHGTLSSLSKTATNM